VDDLTSCIVRPSCFLSILPLSVLLFSFFFFNDTPPTAIYTLSLHDALPICGAALELALDDRRIDRAAGVVDDRIAEKPDRARLRVAGHDGRVRAERPRDRLGMEVGAGVEPGLAEGAERLGLDRGVGEPAQADGAGRHADDEGPARLDPHILGGA